MHGQLRRRPARGAHARAAAGRVFAGRGASPQRARGFCRRPAWRASRSLSHCAAQGLIRIAWRGAMAPPQPAGARRAAR
ncbi:hypothetical protein AQ611_14995 [Burkholderia singularis]|nr:hypothetical protein AQ611_14995 [Burkholderia sp. Bp7605]